jgi:hypothetical protein
MEPHEKQIKSLERDKKKLMHRLDNLALAEALLIECVEELNQPTFAAWVDARLMPGLAVLKEYK